MDILTDFEHYPKRVPYVKSVETYDKVVHSNVSAIIRARLNCLFTYTIHWCESPLGNGDYGCRVQSQIFRIRIRLFPSCGPQPEAEHCHVDPGLPVSQRLRCEDILVAYVHVLMCSLSMIVYYWCIQMITSVTGK